MHMMMVPQDVWEMAETYLRIYLLGLPVMGIYNFEAAIFRSRGDTRTPLISLVIASLLNLVLNLVFVLRFQMGVAGVVWATVIANTISAVLLFRALRRTKDVIHIELKSMHMDRKLLKNIVRIGLPAGIQGMVFSLSNVVIQSAVNSFGADCIAGMTAAQNFDFISYCLMNGFAQAALTFTSQNYGARDCERCKTVWRLSMAMGLGLDVLLLAVFMLSRHQLIRIFTTDENVIRYAMYRFEYEVSLHFLCGSYEITAGALRGLNRSMIPALISVFGTCLVRLVYVFFIFPRVGTPQFLIMVYPVTWIITSILMNTMYFRVRERAFTQLGSA